MRPGIELGRCDPGFCIGSGASTICWPRRAVILVLDILTFLDYNCQIFQHLIWITEFEGKDFLRNVNCRYITREPYAARFLHPGVHGPSC